MSGASSTESPPRGSGDHHRPDDDGAECQGQRHGVSTKRGAGSPSEPRRPNTTRPTLPRTITPCTRVSRWSPPYVLLSSAATIEPTAEPTNAAPAARSPPTSRTPSYEQAGDHPLSQELLGTDPRDERAPRPHRIPSYACKEETDADRDDPTQHPSDASTSMRPWATDVTEASRSLRHRHRPALERRGP